MTPTLGPEAATLHRAVSEVLHYVWDPIGVAGTPEARDEYEGYVDGVCGLLWHGADANAVTAHLVAIADDAMGVRGTQEQAARAAEILLAWRDVVTR
ncbi:hypothetical protein [Pseudoxanthomonas japonensis]|uniref:hypothetical protein n=1 Tax=Pseudoxanthomonas japonensis TaxID=69284 RepID=UPI0020C0C6CB|nr:hypothetical protein [Pseudoxanthomonas japonensis]